jgi:SAM-dependent methyltransferase
VLAVRGRARTGGAVAVGFDLQTLRFVMAAREAGADFSEAITLGRQNLHVGRDAYAREAARFGLDAGPAAVDRVFSAYPYVDTLLTELGARQANAFDASDYEGANFVADLNAELPDDLAGRFSLVIDGGTLEHVFDLPRAIRNVARMLRVGGHFISVNGANNFMGHGFYQFSPELFYRVFSPENGFEVESLVLTEVNEDGIWYEVTDPAVAGERVTLVNNARTYLMMRSRKVAEVAMFQRPPQQSDYHDVNWQQPEKKREMAYLQHPLPQRIVERYFPRPARHLMRRVVQASRRPFASPHLKRSREF